MVPSGLATTTFNIKGETAWARDSGVIAKSSRIPVKKEMDLVAGLERGVLPNWTLVNTNELIKNLNPLNFLAIKGLIDTMVSPPFFMCDEMTGTKVSFTKVDLPMPETPVTRQSSQLGMRL